MNRDVEVAIVGGGLVGAALALQLAAEARVPASRIVIIEPAAPAAPAAGAPIGLRVSAVAPVHRERLAALGVWQRLDATRIGRYERMVVWHEAVPPDSPDVLRFDAAEAGEADLGSIVENDALQAALLAACEAAGIGILRDKLQALKMEADGAHLDLAGGALRAELVVGADGAASTVRALLSLPAQQRDYGQRAIVAVVRGTRPVPHTAWQRFLSTGPLAFLPLPGDQCSIVWSATSARAEALLAMDEPAFLAELQQASAGVLGTLSMVSRRAAFPLRRLAAERYVAARVALVGDAAHVIHPLAGQGVNQGFEDVASLAAALGARPPRESVGALAALRRYARERRAGNAAVGAFVDAIDRLFTRSGPFTAWAAREGMALVGRSAAARRFFIRQAAAGRSSPRR